MVDDDQDDAKSTRSLSKVRSKLIDKVKRIVKAPMKRQKNVRLTNAKRIDKFIKNLTLNSLNLINQKDRSCSPESCVNMDYDIRSNNSVE